MNTISVITVCYNCKNEIERTLKSVISQNFQGMEYIIIDGGSTDGTLDLIKKYEKNIDIIISEKDSGIYDAMNKGIQRSNGEWIVCMNAGDEFAAPDILRKVFSNPLPPDASFIYSDYLKKNHHGVITSYHTDRHKGEVFHQSAIYKKKLHEQYGYYLVTKPYIVSDLLFFLSVPEKYFLKLPFEISLSEESGVSSGLWCREQALALRVVFGQENINSAFLKYWKSRIRRWLPSTLIGKMKRH